MLIFVNLHILNLLVNLINGESGHLPTLQVFWVVDFLYPACEKSVVRIHYTSFLFLNNKLFSVSA